MTLALNQFQAMLRLTDELAPPDITKQTQQDLTFIAEFLCNFDGSTDANNTLASDQTVEVASQEPTPAKLSSRPSINTPGRKTRFNLERLGQYLINQELSFLPETENNPWSNLLSEYPSLNDDSLIIPHFK